MSWTYLFGSSCQSGPLGCNVYQYMSLGGNLCSMQVISGTWWDRIILWLWLASTISMLWKSATCKSSLLLLNHHSDVYYRCHSEYHFSSACTVAYYLSHMSSSSKRKFEITLLCLLERKRIAYFTEDEEFFARLGLITLKMVLKTMSSRAFVLITLKMVLRTMSSRAFVWMIQYDICKSNQLAKLIGKPAPWGLHTDWIRHELSYCTQPSGIVWHGKSGWQGDQNGYVATTRSTCTLFSSDARRMW